MLFLGLDLHISKPEQTLTEEIFNKIYPNSVYKLSDLLSNNLPIDEIKKIFTNGVASKQTKKEELQRAFSSRKKLFNTYKLPVLKKSTKNTMTESSIFFKTPEKAKLSLHATTEGNNAFESTKTKTRNKYCYVKSPTFKITYQIGPSLTDTNSIRIQGKLLERIREKNYGMKKNWGSRSVIGDNVKVSERKEEKMGVGKGKGGAPMICVHEVDFMNVIH